MFLLEKRRVSKVSKDEKKFFLENLKIIDMGLGNVYL